MEWKYYLASLSPSGSAAKKKGSSRENTLVENEEHCSQYFVCNHKSVLYLLSWNALQGEKIEKGLRRGNEQMGRDEESEKWNE